MAESLKKLHERDIAHNDVKFNNFFVFEKNLERNFFDIKIGDLGHAALNKTRSNEEIKNALKVKT